MTSIPKQPESDVTKHDSSIKSILDDHIVGNSKKPEPEPTSVKQVHKDPVVEDPEKLDLKPSPVEKMDDVSNDNHKNVKREKIRNGPNHEKEQKAESESSHRQSSESSGSPASCCNTSDDDNEGNCFEEDTKEWRQSERKRYRSSVSLTKTMEFSLGEMFPDMSLLIRKKKKDWNFNDPDLIRALYVESETNLLSKWKARNAIIKSLPKYTYKNNRLSRLRIEHLHLKKEKERRENERLEELLKLERGMPEFPVVQTLTNITTELRHTFCRNHPSVPRHVIEHYRRHRKPPFKFVHGSKFRRVE